MIDVYTFHRVAWQRAGFKQFLPPPGGRGLLAGTAVRLLNPFAAARD